MIGGGWADDVSVRRAGRGGIVAAGISELVAAGGTVCRGGCGAGTLEPVAMEGAGC